MYVWAFLFLPFVHFRPPASLFFSVFVQLAKAMSMPFDSILTQFSKLKIH
jgi:hypothetical protein